MCLDKGYTYQEYTGGHHNTLDHIALAIWSAWINYNGTNKTKCGQTSKLWDHSLLSLGDPEVIH